MPLIRRIIVACVVSALMFVCTGWRRPIKQRFAGATVINLTSASLPSTISCTRATGTLYAQTSASTFTTLAGGTCAYENRGDSTPGGWWAFGPYTNQITQPFDVTNPVWGTIGNITVAANGGATCPDGALANVYTITQTAAGASSFRYDNVAPGVANLGGLSLLWLRDNAGNPPLQPGYVSDNVALPGHYATPNGTGTTWRLVANGHNFGTANDIIEIFPAGTNQAVGSTGAIDVCGAQIAGAASAVDGEQLVNSLLPLAAASTTKQDMTFTTPADVINNGELDFEVSFIGGWWRSFHETPYGSQFDFWSMSTPDGELSLRYDNTGNNGWILKVRGVDVLSMTAANMAPMWPNTNADDFTLLPQEQTIRCWYKPVTAGQCGCVSTVNGAFQKQSTAATAGGALAAPTAVHLGNLNGTSNFMHARFTQVKIYQNTASNAVYPAPVVVLGDSLQASNSQYTATASHIWTANEERAGTHGRIAVLALGGDTIEGQQAVFDASIYKGNATVRAFVLQPGINNITAGDSEVTLATKYQALVNDIRAANPAASVICGAITPACAFWGAACPANEAVRLAFNNDIMNTGGLHPIVGCDIRENGYLPGLTAGDGKSLIASCDEGTGISAPDGIHYTHCRYNVAQYYRADLISLGL